MELRRKRRLATVVLVVLVIGSLSIFGAADSFHSYTDSIQARSSGNNVSAVIIMKLGYLSVNAIITVFSNQISPVTVYFMNGSSVQVSNYYQIHVHLNKTARFDNQQSSIFSSTGLNLTLTSSHPIIAGVIEDTQIQNASTVPEPGNSYMFYVSGYTNIQVSAVGEAI